MSHLFPSGIKTERLRLEPRRSDSVNVREAYEVCSSDPGIEDVTEYLPWDPHPTPKETHDFLERGDEHWGKADRADYAIRPRDGEDGAGELAGFGGLGLDWEKRTGFLGLWLRKRFWGRGYSGERAVALAELAFEHLDLELVAVTHHVDNEKSRRAIEKYIDRLGGQREGRFRNHMVFDSEPVDEVRYSVTREEYRQAADIETDVTFQWEQ